MKKIKRIVAFILVILVIELTVAPDYLSVFGTGEIVYATNCLSDDNSNSLDDDDNNDDDCCTIKDDVEMDLELFVSNEDELRHRVIYSDDKKIYLNSSTEGEIELTAKLTSDVNIENASVRIMHNGNDAKIVDDTTDEDGVRTVIAVVSVSDLAAKAKDGKVSFTAKAIRKEDYDHNEASVSVSGPTYYCDSCGAHVSKYVLAGVEGTDFYINKFGIFANKPVIFSVEALDGDNSENETGVYDITVDGATKEIDDDGNETGNYVVKPDEEEKSITSAVSATAIDFFGKSESNDSVAIYYYDVDGEEKNISYEDGEFPVTVDMIVPDVTIALEDEDDVTKIDGQKWHTDNKDIDIEISDVDSGVKGVEVFINNQQIFRDDDDNIFLTDGDKAKELLKDTYNYKLSLETLYSWAASTDYSKGYTLKIVVTDNSGNVATETATYSYDAQAPVVDKIEFDIADAYGQTTVDDYSGNTDYKYFFNSGFGLKITVSDPGCSSGLDRIEYRLLEDKSSDSEKKKIYTAKIDEEGVAKIDIPLYYKGGIAISVYDKAGNVTKVLDEDGKEKVYEYKPAAIMTDDKAPEMIITNPFDSDVRDNDGSFLYNTDQTISVDIEDEDGGIKSVSYKLEAEKGSYDTKTVNFDDRTYSVGDKIDEFTVTAVNKNLVTGVTASFAFEEDNSKIKMSFSATDRCGNEIGWQDSNSIAIDKTAPVISVSFSKGVDEENEYYNKENKAQMTVTVLEKNFDATLIEQEIEDTYRGASVNIGFESTGVDEYKAIVDFPEGDFDISIYGEDKAGNPAVINDSSVYTNSIKVDFTAPVITAEFDILIDSEVNDTFNTQKPVKITVEEHNFDSELINLVVKTKEPGSDHNGEGFEETFYEIFSEDGWQDSTSNQDIHTITLMFGEDEFMDGVYMISVEGSDMATNVGNSITSSIFEMDTIAPVIIARNDVPVLEDDTSFLDVYDYTREDDEAPTIEFSDINFDSIVYTITEYVPVYTDGHEIGKITPVSTTTKEADESIFKLPEFDEDGVYAVEIVAYDTAGNESILNRSTYMRMINTDVLAYIEESSKADGTGYYALEDDNGPISKRPENIEDVNIVVLAKNSANTSISLIDENENETETGISAVEQESVYAVDMIRYTLLGSYFEENYSKDTDTTLYLRANSDSESIDLAQIHIDNIAPTCELPTQFKDWGTFAGFGKQTITLTNVSEALDDTACVAYVTKDDETREILMDYDEEDNQVSLTIEPGTYSIGLVLADRAGNTYTIKEVSHLAVGSYRTIERGLTVMAIFMIGVVTNMLFKRKKKAEM